MKAFSEVAGKVGRPGNCGQVAVQISGSIRQNKADTASWLSAVISSCHFPLKLLRPERGACLTRLIRLDSERSYFYGEGQRTMASYSPGQRIEARCTRCRDITGHIIVVVLDGEVAKVECCACGSVHKYYPAENKARPVKERPLRVQSGQERGEAVLNRSSALTRVELAAASGAGTGTVPRPAKLSRAEQQSAKLREELEHQWQEAMARNPGMPKPYAMDGAFALGSLVEHPSFGVGMVLSVTPPDRIDVLFREGIKALRCRC